MDRSQSILKSLVAAVLIISGLLGAGAALAQRAISNSANGGETDLVTPQIVPTLVGCNLSNTNALVSAQRSGGSANACDVEAFGESIGAASSLVDAYGGSSLSLATDAIPDRATDNGPSSGGLFSFSGDGQRAVTLRFGRAQTDDFLFVFSGLYDSGDTQSAWSAYYLFDNVFVDLYNFNNGLPRGQMNFELSELVRVANSSDLTRNYTNGLVVNQVSIYTLDRQAVPEPGSLALAGLSLALLAAARRLRRSNRV